MTLSSLIQFVISGLTIGAVYALVALGFSLVFNGSGVINFAQGESVMLGGMTTYLLTKIGIPVVASICVAGLVAAFAGMALERIAIRPAKSAGVFSLIVITIGASIFTQGAVQFLIGRNQYAVAPFSGSDPIQMLGAILLPQSVWMLVVSLALMAALGFFFRYTKLGKATIAVAQNRTSATLVGIHPDRILMLSFGLSGLVGGIAGAVSVPITMVSYDSGLMLGLKGFVAAVLGGLGKSSGAVAGGLLLGLTEAMTAGYISSDYKDAIPFVLILLVLRWRPQGLFVVSTAERV
jgi:branched-chain amino acid transport system permease protein